MKLPKRISSRLSVECAATCQQSWTKDTTDSRMSKKIQMMMMRMKKSHTLKKKRSKNILNNISTEISRQIKSRWASSVGDNNADNVNIMNTKAKTAGMFWFADSVFAIRCRTSHTLCTLKRAQSSDYPKSNIPIVTGCWLLFAMWHDIDAPTRPWFRLCLIINLKNETTQRTAHRKCFTC